jgi:hypothetical protein
MSGIHGSDYSDEEIAFLTANYLHMSQSAMARALGRTTGSVSARAHSLGLEKGSRLYRDPGEAIGHSERDGVMTAQKREEANIAFLDALETIHPERAFLSQPEPKQRHSLPKRFSPAPTQTLTGSTAAMCQQWGE